MNKKSREQVINMYPELTSKAIQNGGSGASFWRVGGSILESFWGSGRVLAPKCVLEGVLGGSWAIFRANMAPTWPQVGSQDGAKTEKKSMQKSIKKSMPFKIRFWSDFGRFLEGKWRQVGTKIDQKSMPVAKRDFLLNRALPAAGARKMGFRGSKLGAKTDQESIKIWSPRWGAS